ncbi:Pentatricopeptide repeat-containing protein [Hordeum vulgare]|nr:Pentatricopeptide repeat-containing protein [Hordeum vulgare]
MCCPRMTTCLRSPQWVTLDQGWATFTVVHQIKINYMVTFKFLTLDTMKVIVFNDDGIEVVTKCGRHDDAFTVNA